MLAKTFSSDGSTALPGLVFDISSPSYDSVSMALKDAVLRATPSVK